MSCEKWEKFIVLFIYEEMNEADTAALNAHLAVCENCRAKLEQYKAVQKAVPETLIDPDESTLKMFRNAVTTKIRQLEPRRTKGFAPFTFLRPAPAFQAGFAVLLVFLGFLIGRQNVQKTPAVQSQESLFEKLLTGTQQISAASSVISPSLMGVEKIKISAADSSIEIYYNTVNDVKLQGGLDNQAINYVLQNAILQEQNPAVRLHAVKALLSLVENEKHLPTSYFETLQRLFLQEQNQGIKLMALKVLNAADENQTINKILTSILTIEKTTPVRIEAFDILARHAANSQQVPDFLYVARSDSNDYISYKAKELLKVLGSTQIPSQKGVNHETI